MKIFRHLPSFGKGSPCLLTIGNFDGVHLGHQALINKLVEESKKRKIPAAVLIFEPHPAEYFSSSYPRVKKISNPGIKNHSSSFSSTIPRILMLRDKLEMLGYYGMDVVYIIRFDAHFASLSSEAFVKILVDHFKVQLLIVGDDFRFGANREGNFSTLLNYQSNFDLISLKTKKASTAEGCERVSSTSVRNALSAGDIKKALYLLGHPLFLSGRVRRGNQLGRKLGFPTLNIHVPLNHAIAGIFVVRVHGISANSLAGVGSLGKRPSIELDGDRWMEVHLFDFEQDCYGKMVRIEFLHRLRPEEKFDSLDALKKQIAQDVQDALSWFRSKNSMSGPGLIKEHIC